MISRTSKLNIRKRGLDLSRPPLLNVFCLLVSCQLLVGRNKCRNLSIYLNAINRPFPSCLLPLFQTKSKCEIFHMKMSMICIRMDLWVKSFSYERFRTWTRFETEAKENSEMAYCFEALFYVYLIKIVVIVSAQPALAKAEKLTTRYSKSSFKIHLPFLPKPRELKAY